MIEIGNTVINYIEVGNTTPGRIDVGNTQVWPDIVPASITISPSTTSVTSAAVTTYITISVTASSNSWTVSSSDSWISDLEKVSNTQARFKVNANGTIDSRTGYIYFKIDGTTYATFTVSQAAGMKVLNLNPNTLSGLTEEATAGTISVTTNLPTWGAWVVYKDPNTNWITASKQGSTGVSWSVTENTTGALRQAQIEVSGDGVSKIVQVRQTAGYVWNISSTGATVSSGAGNIQVTVNSSYHNEALEVFDSVATNTMNASMSLISSGSAGYFVYNITYPQRTVSSQGTFVAVFRQSGTNQTLTYTLYQSGAPQVVEYINISPTALTNVSSAGTAVTFSITASKSSWTASTSSSWITLSKNSSVALQATIAPATSTSQRTGTISFKIGDTTYATADVTQEGKYVLPDISGLTVAATYNDDWVLGSYYTGSHGGPNNDEIRNIVVANKGTFSETKTATVSMKYTNLGGTQVTISNQNYSVQPATISIPSGGTCYGYAIITAVKSLDEATDFTVL